MKTYPDLPNPDLLDRIPLAARSVLDVGCGTGALGAAYRSRNPRARLLGIELNEAAASIAGERYDRVAAVDVEAEPMPFGDRVFDCVVYGDVLEHLRDPWAVVEAQARALAPDGVILICVPNVEHWSFIERLLRGTWNYEDQGLFDSGHLRWFSMANMRRDLAELGLVAYDTSPRIFNADAAGQFIEAARPLLAALGVDPAEYAPRARPLQLVWRVGRRERARMMVHATMLKPVGGVSDLRIVNPLAAMSTDPAVIARISGYPEEPPPDVVAERVLVLHRPILIEDDGLRRLRRLIADGWLIVTEFDDHPDYFPAMRTERNWTFAGAHAVQTSTEALADILRARNPELAVFPNAVSVLPTVANFSERDQMTVFFGALNREADWRPLMPVLNEVAARAGERLRFLVVHDEAFFEALETPRKAFQPTCDHATYLRLLGACEISFMPLGDTEFNRAKSDLKFIEAGACRAASLASRVVYGATVEDGRTGVLFGDADELRAGLTGLLADFDRARAIGEAARRYVADNRMLAYQTAVRAQWYRHLWSRREALTRALLARVPALADPLAETPGE